MNDATWVYINRMANAIRLAFDIAGPIGDIDHLVKELGGSVVKKPDLDQLYGKTIRKTYPLYHRAVTSSDLKAIA
jgi:hypothetical protein